MSESYCNQSDDTVGFDVLAAEISVKLPAVAEPIIMASIFRASVEFLSKTRIYKDTIKLDYQQYVEEYPVEAGDCNSILNVEEVRLNDVSIPFTKNREWIKLPEAYLGSCTGSKFEADVTLGLSKNACELPRFIYERYGKGLIHAVLADLYGMYGEEWYDLGKVKFYGGLGVGSIADAKDIILAEEHPDGIPIVGTELIL